MLKLTSLPVAEVLGTLSLPSNFVVSEVFVTSAFLFVVAVTFSVVLSVVASVFFSFFFVVVTALFFLVVAFEPFFVASLPEDFVGSAVNFVVFSFAVVFFYFLFVE